MVLDFLNGLIYWSLGHSARMMIYDMKYPHVALQLLFFSRGGGGGRGKGREAGMLYRPPLVASASSRRGKVLWKPSNPAVSEDNESNANLIL